LLFGSLPNLVFSRTSSIYLHTSSFKIPVINKAPANRGLHVAGRTEQGTPFEGHRASQVARNTAWAGLVSQGAGSQQNQRSDFTTCCGRPRLSETTTQPAPSESRYARHYLRASLPAVDVRSTQPPVRGTARANHQLAASAAVHVPPTVLPPFLFREGCGSTCLPSRPCR
jgi:hypothetical protein